MSFDMIEFFKEIDEILIKMDEGEEDAAEMFASRIFAARPAFSASKGCRIYQEDAVIRYAQWILTVNRKLGIAYCIDALYQFAGQFWYSDTPVLTEEQVSKVFHMVDRIFPYMKKVSPTESIDILLFDAQHESLNGETTAVFTPDGMLGCICMYRMREETLSPVSVLLHELGHLLHIRGTGTMDKVPPSFPIYLRRLGTQPAILTIPQLQDVFADTFMLAVMSRYPELEVPIPGLSNQAFKASYMDKLSGILSDADFQRIYLKVKADRAKLEEQQKELERQIESPVPQEDRAKELVQRFIDSVPTNRELLFSLIERIELSESKEIYIKFRFKQLDFDCFEANS